MLRYLTCGLLALALVAGCPQPTAMTETDTTGTDTTQTDNADTSGNTETTGTDTSSGDTSTGGTDTSGDASDDSGTDTTTNNDSTATDNSSGSSDDGAGTTTSNGNTMSSSERQLALDALQAMNDHRAGQGLGPLTWYEEGAQVAYEHSAAMADGGFFAHVDPITGKDPATRALEAGITHNPDGFISPDSGNPFVGENLYTETGFADTGDLPINSWIGSPGHHTQMVAPLPVSGASTMPAWTHCGIGVKVDGSTSRWTAMFFKDPN